jgi:hypothetical protein
MKPYAWIWMLTLCFAATGSFAQSQTPDTAAKPVQLKTVHIIQYHFFKDSAAFREEYSREMSFRRPKFFEVYKITAIDINKLYKATQIKKNRKKMAFRHMLLEKEQEMYVNSVYTPSLVNKVTQLDGDSLQRFMNYYRPDYSFIKGASDYDIYLEIKKHYGAFIKTRDSVPSQP